MKNITNINLLNFFGILSLLIGASGTAYAHFGSKGPFGGSVSCSTIYDSTVYIGTLEGGVFRNTNSQLVAWSPMPVGLKSGRITALAHSGSYLFAGTRDSGMYIYNGFVGTDRYWIKINKGLTNLSIISLYVLDSVSILAGTNGGGLFKTTDKGANWIAINSEAMNNSVVTSLTKVGSKIVGTTLKGGVYISGDDGKNWSSFNDANTLNIDSTIAVSFNVTTNELAVINKNGLFILTNASTAATPAYTASKTGLPVNIVLRSISNNGATWYVASDQGVFTSSTGTINWTSANAGLATNDVMIVVPYRAFLLAGTNKEGIYKSGPTAISWKENNVSFNNMVTYAMETSGVLVVVVATEKGVFVSTDLASTYQRANIGLSDSFNVTNLKFFGAILFAATKNGGVYTSADTGKTWTNVTAGLTTLNIKKIFTTNTSVYALDIEGKLFQFGSTKKWISIQSGLPNTISPTSMTYIGSKIVLGTLGQGVFIKDTSDANWTAANNSLTNLNVTSIVSNGTKLFAGTDGSGVFVSDGSAINWKPCSPVTISHTSIMELDGSKIQELAYYGGYVYASYKGGLLATSNNGVTWIAGGNQFNLPSYTNVKSISFVTTRVFVMTDNNSVYSNALSELPVIVTAVSEYSAALTTAVKIFPNPSFGNFTIDLKDIKASVKGIILYDNAGRILQEHKNIKGSSIQINASYPAGTFFVQINTDKGFAIQKVLVGQ